MATYLVLNLVMSAAILGGVRIVTGGLVWNSRVAMTRHILIICTAVFDSVIVATNIVAYDSAKILGWYIGAAPVEDFFYAVISAFIIPALWVYFRRRHAGN